MNLRNALRYIYIYIYRLNLAKAGWEHDLQPREAWKRRLSARHPAQRNNKKYFNECLFTIYTTCRWLEKRQYCCRRIQNIHNSASTTHSNDYDSRTENKNNLWNRFVGELRNCCNVVPYRQFYRNFVGRLTPKGVAA